MNESLPTRRLVRRLLFVVVAMFGFGFALVGAVVGEFLGAKHGIGLLISTAQGAFNANGVFAAMIILAVVALVVEFLITLVENRLVKWRPQPFNEQAT